MKEFDFDELDRAVSSLMDKAGADQPPKSQPQTVVSSNQTEDKRQFPEQKPEHAVTSPAEVRTDGAITPSPHRGVPVSPATSETVVSDGQSMDKKPDDAPEKPDKSANRITPHRSGRFMDMVHPSADMKTDQPKTAADQLASGSRRKTVNIKPLNPDLKAPAVDVVKPAKVPEKDVGDESSSTADDWPDPIDQPTPQPAPEPAKPDELLLDAHASPDEDEDLTKSDDNEEALGAALESIEKDNGSLDSAQSEEAKSPFLPGTKVEKRPLGGDSNVSAPEDAPALETANDTLSSASTTDQGETQEFDQRLMQIESGDQPTSDVADSESTSASTENPIPEKSAPAAVSKPASTSVQPKGPISIPQQYQEKPSSGDASNGAIFDTATYHQPLAHPAKKKSGWIWVLLIVALIVIGAAAGAIAFQQGYL